MFDCNDSSRSGADTAVNTSRRRFLRVCAGAGLLLGAQSTWGKPLLRGERRLALYNLHTGESVVATYWADGRYITDELLAINRVLRDHRSGDVFPIDVQLLDTLNRLSAKIDARRPFHVISGYRSQASNEKLRSHSGGVAKRSYHLQGKAIDIRLPGRDLTQLHRAALHLQAGGVGLYSKSDFVHVDVGPVRQWRG